MFTQINDTDLNATNGGRSFASSSIRSMTTRSPLPSRGPSISSQSQSSGISHRSPTQSEMRRMGGGTRSVSTTTSSSSLTNSSVASREAGNGGGIGAGGLAAVTIIAAAVVTTAVCYEVCD